MITWFTETVGTAAYTALGKEVLEAGIVADVRVLVDRGGNHPADLLRFVELALGIHSREGRVIVACDMGVSRSRVIALGVLIRLGYSFDDGLDLVLQVAGNPEINLALLRDFARAVGVEEDKERCGATVLLLGGSGFVGRNMTRLLASSATVLAPTRGEVDLLSGPVQLSRYFDRHACPIILYAAHPRSHHSVRSFSDSLLMLKNTLTALQGGDCRFLYISSLQVFSGNARRIRPSRFEAEEGDDPIPFGTYAEAKTFGERLVGYQADYHKLRASILRPSGLYGPGMAGSWLVPKLVRAAAAHELISTHRYRNGLPELELLHVKDLVAAVDAVIADENAPAILHIGSGETVTTQELAAAAIEATGSRSQLTLLDIDSEIDRVVSKPSKWLRDRGWRPQVSLKQGLRDLEELNHEHT